MNTSQFKHKEAFCLMKYRDQHGNEEIIWNSRDGVTPFFIRNKQGNEATHVDWHNDQFAPDHQPKKGERIFVDLTPERAREIATRQVERWWDNKDVPSMQDFYASKEEAIGKFAEGMYHGGESVDLIEVGDEPTSAPSPFQAPKGPREATPFA